MAARASDRPRVRVAAVIMVDDSIVLVRQRRDAEPYYLLPGGGVDAGETLAEALEREVAEETGLGISLIKPIFINDTISPQGDRHLVNITFLTKIQSGAIFSVPTDRAIEAIELVAVDAITTLDLRPSIGAELLAAYRAGFDVPAAYLGPIWTPENRKTS